ncbi:MAG TPA: hypothetical protein VIJ68_01050 [Candidatus Saccharimonadales bacterium]
MTSEPRPPQIHSTPHYHESTDEPLRLGRDDAFEVADLLVHNDNTVVYDDMWGLETVDDAGTVKFLIEGRGEAKKGEKIQTSLTELPIANYSDEDGQHTVKLYAVRVSGYYIEYGPPVQQTIFAVEQITGKDGSTRLGSTPGMIQSESRGDRGRPEYADNTQLTNAVLTGFNGADRLKAFIKAKQLGEDTSQIDARLEQVLRARGPERIDISAFSPGFWRDRGFSTKEEVEQERRVAQQKRIEREERWSQASRLKKLGARVTWHLKDPEDRPMSHKDLLQ